MFIFFLQYAKHSFSSTSRKWSRALAKILISKVGVAAKATRLFWNYLNRKIFIPLSGKRTNPVMLV